LTGLAHRASIILREADVPKLEVLRDETPGPRAVRVAGVQVGELAAPTVPQDRKSGVSAFFGIWPGDETDEELLAAVRAIR